jgi:structural maintenance of chromosome 1
VADTAEEVEVDLSQLPDEKKGVPAGPAATMLEEEYRSELRRLAAELARMRPNLRAGDQLSGVEERADGAAKEAAAAHRDVEDIDGRFEAVRKARRELFMGCFKKVAEEINNIYGMLTGGARAGQDGGSAYLDLEDLENPFNGSVKFSTRPPAKRFSDVSLLSGGERTLAAMALLFALQAYQRPPFLVLDEIDAYLDPRNVQALSRYMQQVDCQTIVISLKDRLFSRGQGLVGISKDKSRGASVVLSLDLDRVRQATARRAEAAPLPPAPVAAG